MLYRSKLQVFLVKRLNISNKGAQQLILSGVVLVNGESVDENIVIQTSDEISCRGEVLQKKKTFYYIALYKPRGIETTLNKEVEDNLLTVFQFDEYVYYVGRLDKYSEGLLLLTNDGKLSNKISSPRFEHEKEYEVEVDKTIVPAFLEGLKNGLFIKGRKTKPVLVHQMNETCFNITLTEGMNRQIRRMCSAQAYEVKTLKRIRIMNIVLNELKPGEYRFLNEEEKQGLIGQATKQSGNS